MVGSEVDTTTGRTKLTLDLQNADKLNFINKYKSGGQGEISGIKWVDTRMPEDEEFEFEIKEVGVTKPIATIKNTGTTINYPKFVYQVDPDGEPGTDYDPTANTITVTVKKVEDLPEDHKYYYTISEVDGQQHYIEYDKSTINVTAEVQPNASGKLDVTITKDKPDFNFTNKYEAKGALKLEGKKTLLGRLLNSGEFTFRLVQVDENGNETGELIPSYKKAVSMRAVFGLQDRLAKKYNKKKTARWYYSNYDPGYIDIKLKDEWVTERTRIRFEDTTLSIPAHYDEVLTCIYGDYMKLPPKEQRVPSHGSTEIQIYG